MEYKMVQYNLRGLSLMIYVVKNHHDYYSEIGFAEPLRYMFRILLSKDKICVYAPSEPHPSQLVKTQKSSIGLSSIFLFR